MMWIALAYLYLAGVCNGLILVGLDGEGGEETPLGKMILATILWPLLMPYLLIKKWVSK